MRQISVAGIGCSKGSVAILTVQNIRDDDKGEGFGRQEEADMDAIVPGDDEKRVFGKLKTRTISTGEVWVDWQCAYVDGMYHLFC